MKKYVYIKLADTTGFAKEMVKKNHKFGIIFNDPFLS